MGHLHQRRLLDADSSGSFPDDIGFRETDAGVIVEVLVCGAMNVLPEGKLKTGRRSMLVVGEAVFRTPKLTLKGIRKTAILLSFIIDSRMEHLVGKRLPAY